MRRIAATLPWLAVAACDRSAPAPATNPTKPPPIPLAASDAALVLTSDAETLAEPNRPLTTSEIAMLQPIFKDSIDYTHVRVINNNFPFQPDHVYMTPRGHVYAPGELWREDFSQAQGYRAVFVHEMTHVWQFANGMDLVSQGVIDFAKYHGDYEKAYPYELDAARDLVEYGMEQQASIIEDFFLISENDYPRRITNRALSTEQRNTLYAKVLAQLSANPRYARGLDATQIAAKHATRSEQSPPGPQACKESEAEHGAAHMCSWRFEPTTPQ